VRKKNPYAPVTAEQRELKEKTQQEKENLLKEAQELANKCLHNKDFVKYKAKYTLLEHATIDALIDYIEPDPMQYAFNVRRTVDELRQLRLLLRGVEADSRERK